jgi:hypothetical protein
MANACAAFEKLALQAAAAQQNEVSAASQPMQQGATLTHLDAVLQCARQETPAELQKWWELQLASTRVRTLRDELVKWTKHCQDLHVTSQAREHLRKLHGVEGAVGKGDIPAEMLTVQSWSAYKREQQLQQQQALTQAQMRNAHTFQSTSPLQNGGAAWLPKVGAAQDVYIINVLCGHHH